MFRTDNTATRGEGRRDGAGPGPLPLIRAMGTGVRAMNKGGDTDRTAAHRRGNGARPARIAKGGPGDRSVFGPPPKTRDRKPLGGVLAIDRNYPEWAFFPSKQV